MATGKRLWRVVPKRDNDYNVPTPMVWNGQLVICTENNGTRLFRFGAKGQIEPVPAAAAKELAPDTHSPVIVGDRLFGVWQGLHAFDLKQGLKKLWTIEDDAFNEYAALVAAKDKLLVFSQEGELILVDAAGDKPKIVGRAKPLPSDKDIYSHPAFVGSRMYLRGNETLAAFELEAK